MPSKIPLSRRDFLKLLSLLPALYAEKVALGAASPTQQGNAPGVIVIVFDALSALNMSLYGYRRKTSPNIERFARRANVYHAHYSPANFTSSGTASLLTGMYPWTHRAFHYEGQVLAERVRFNLFHYWGEDGLRLGFAQNPWADIFLDQFAPWLDMHVDLREFSLDKTPFYDSLFRNDALVSENGLDSFAFELEPGMSSASILALIRKVSLFLGKEKMDKEYVADYPLGIPKTLNDADTSFLLGDLFAGLMKLTSQIPPSALAYLHLYPPHYPYAPRKEFMRMSEDGWQPIRKPPAYFLQSVSDELEREINVARGHYDAYIATVDAEFGRLFDFMEGEGILDRNYVVLTSDHGDQYSRGVFGHNNNYLYESLIRIPLLISSPEQTSRVDIDSPTSSVDVAPTLLALTGRPVPEACEGVLLPGLGGREDMQRSIFAIDAKSGSVREPIKTATIALRKGIYRLNAYLGNERIGDGYELYDLQNDPERINNLASSKPGILGDLKAEVDAKLREINIPYSTTH